MIKNLIFFLLFVFVSCPLFAQQTGESSSAAISQPPGEKSPAQNRISLEIKGMEITDVLKMLATRAGYNIVIGKNVTGRVTLFLKDVDVRDAFEICLASNDLAYEKKGAIISIMTQRDYELLYGERFQDKKQTRIVQLKYSKPLELSKVLTQLKTNIGKIIVNESTNTLVLIDTPEKVAEMADFIQKVDLPVETKTFELKYASAEKLSAKLKDFVTKETGSMSVDERTNKISVTDYPHKLEALGRIIAEFDEKTPQVLIDSQVVEIKPSDKFEMGVDWDYWIRKNFRSTASLPLGTNDNRLFIGTTSKTPEEKGQYKAVLDLLRTIGDTKILSSPRIMALNNQEAKILVGTKDAFITSATSQSGDTSVTSQSVNFVDVGIKLYVTPTINKDGFVIMKIKPEISSAERTDIISEGKVTQIPIVTTSETETTVMVKDGVTIIIGGLKKDERTKNVRKIPLLGDVPLAGFFFRSTSDEMKSTELVILLTPHIISGEDALTDFDQLKPSDGLVLDMYKGKIVGEKNVRQDKEKAETSAEYYKLVNDKVKALALFAHPEGVKGSVSMQFCLTKEGVLVGEPVIVSSTNKELILSSVSALKNACPFPAFPRVLNKDSEVFFLTLAYE